jgi:Holliday junction resolvase
MSRIYEWELKGILQGDAETLKKVTTTCSKDEKDSYFKIRDRPFVVVRSAGSQGVDLMAVRNDISFPIEVKSSVNRRIRMSNSPQLKEQSEKFKRACEKAGLLPIYAFRLKRVRGDSWRLFTLEVNEDNLFGRMKRAYKRLPKAHESKDGYYILRWDDGMALNRFIEYITL